MGFLDRFRFWGRSPLTIVEIIIGIFSVVSGLYVLSPLLTYSVAVNGATPVIALISHPVGIALYGAFYAFSGFLIIAGVISRRYQLRSWGLFLNILVRFYNLIATFVIQGLLPLTWLSSLVVVCVALVCYVVVRGFIIRGVKYGG